jgi:hypothetical protein
MLLVVIHNLDFEGVAMMPYEANSELIVDSNTALTSSIPAQRFQLIPWRHFQVI